MSSPPPRDDAHGTATAPPLYRAGKAPVLVPRYLIGIVAQIVGQQSLVPCTDVSRLQRRRCPPGSDSGPADDVVVA